MTISIFQPVPSVSERKEALTNAILLDGVNESTSPSGASAKTVFNAPTSSSNIEGTVNASGDGWLMLSIPYENGWTAYVDGKEVDIVRADVAFCAIQISEGEHSVSFRYQTPLIIPGMIISAICVTAFVALCVFEYRYNKKYSSEDLKNNDSF